jgi:hypothetical protein
LQLLAEFVPTWGFIDPHCQSRIDMTLLTMEVIHALQKDYGSRFLSRKDNRWVLVADTAIQKKVNQSLRLVARSSRVKHPPGRLSSAVHCIYSANLVKRIVLAIKKQALWMKGALANIASSSVLVSHWTLTMDKHRVLTSTTSSKAATFYPHQDQKTKRGGGSVLAINKA